MGAKQDAPATPLGAAFERMCGTVADAYRKRKGKEAERA